MNERCYRPQTVLKYLLMQTEKCLMKCLSEDLVFTKFLMKCLNELNYYLCNANDLDKFRYAETSKMNG